MLPCLSLPHLKLAACWGTDLVADDDRTTACARCTLSRGGLRRVGVKLRERFACGQLAGVGELMEELSYV